MPQTNIEIVARDRTGAALGNVEKRLRRIDQAANKTNSAFGGITSRLVALGATLGTALGVKNIIQVNARFEDLRTTLASVSGGVEQGAQSFRFIEKFATQTQFSVEDLTTTFIKLKTAGIEPTEELLTTFTDAAAVTTDQLGSLQAITDLFARTTQGGLGLEEINRLTDRGIPALEILNDKLGLSRMEISEFGKTAEGARIITEALAEGINEQFGGATENRLQNLSTRMSNLGIAMDSFKDKIGIQLAPALGGFLDKITNGIVNSDMLARTIGNVLGSAVSGISVLFDFAAQNSDTLTRALAAMVGIAGAVGLGRALGAAKTAMLALNTAMRMNPIGLVVTAVAGLVAVMGFENGLGKTFAQVKAAVEVLGGAFSAFSQFIREKVSAVINKLKEVFLGFVQSAINGYNAMADFLPLIDRFEGDAADLTGVIVDLGKDGLEYVTGKADEMKDAILDAIPDEVVDLATDLADAVNEAGEAYDKAQEEAKKFAQEQQKLNQALSGPVVAGGGVNVAGAGDPKVTPAILKAQEEQKKIREALSKRIVDLKNSLRTEEEAENDRYRKALRDLQDYYGDRVAFDTEYFKLSERLTAQHNKNIEAMNKRAYSNQLSLFQQGKFGELDLTKITKEKEISFLKDAGMSILDQMATQNRKAFELQKKLQIAQAVMNIATGVTKALAQGGIFGLLMAGGIVAMGAAQIAAINSQQYQGRRFGGPVSKRDSYIVGENGPEVFTPGATGRIIPNEGLGGSRPVAITFNIDATDAASVDQLLVERRAMITNMVRQAVQEKGNRPNF